jgi:hypothetical protein
VEAQKQHEASLDRVLIDKRHQPRFKLEVKIRVSSRTSGLLRGHTVDISESGISAILRNEVFVGEVVELEFTLPFGLVNIYAIVRQRNAFRYGFQFVETLSTKALIQSTCRQLAVEQTLLGGN